MRHTAFAPQAASVGTRGQRPAIIPSASTRGEGTTRPSAGGCTRLAPSPCYRYVLNGALSVLYDHGEARERVIPRDRFEFYVHWGDSYSECSINATAAV